MKSFILALAVTFAALHVLTDGETKKVCVDVKDKEGKPVKDSKTGNVKQSCKEVEVHKKLEGTKIPDKK